MKIGKNSQHILTVIDKALHPRIAQGGFQVSGAASQCHMLRASLLQRAGGCNHSIDGARHRNILISLDRLGWAEQSRNHHPIATG